MADLQAISGTTGCPRCDAGPWAGESKAQLLSHLAAAVEMWSAHDPPLHIPLTLRLMAIEYGATHADP